MRINYDLLRDIMIDVANANFVDGIPSTCLSYGNTLDDLIFFHVKILVENGYLSGLDSCTKTSNGYINLQMTLRGQALLDSIENKDIWSKVKSYLKTHALEFGFETIRTALAVISKNL